MGFSAKCMYSSTYGAATPRGASVSAIRGGEDGLAGVGTAAGAREWGVGVSGGTGIRRGGGVPSVVPFSARSEANSARDFELPQIAGNRVGAGAGVGSGVPDVDIFSQRWGGGVGEVAEDEVDGVGVPGETFPRSGKNAREGVPGQGTTGEGEEVVVCSRTEIGQSRQQEKTRRVERKHGRFLTRFQNRSGAGARGVGGVGTGRESGSNTVRSGVDRSPLPGSTWSVISLITI